MFYKQGVKSVQDLSIESLGRIKERVSIFDAQSMDLREKIKNDLRKKIIKEKNWNMLCAMFNESPPVRL